MASDVLGATRRPSASTAAAAALATDSRYRKYATAVDKALGMFSNVQDWADCISFLNQLLKTLQSYQQYKEIPHKQVVAKRLSQCLNPALPSGVHQRALDVYAHVLAVLGLEGLRRDLHLWTYGLLSFFEYAATAVKPLVLELFERHYLTLHENLRPLTKASMLALLPGLEEENGEHFERVLDILDGISAAVTRAFFYQCLWLVLLTTPTARGPALIFLQKRLPPLETETDIANIVGSDLGLLLRGVAVTLEDDNMLVRRGALDFLLEYLRLDGAVLSRVSRGDVAILLRAAISVVLRRDLALNRRLYNWILGPDEHSAVQVAYFQSNSLELLSNELKSELSAPLADYPPSRPYKIFLSLLDKWELGEALTTAMMQETLVAIIRVLKISSDAENDVISSARSLFEAFEPVAVWRTVYKQLSYQLMRDDTFDPRYINMALNLLTNFGPPDEEVQRLHLPLIFVSVLELLEIHLNSQADEGSSDFLLAIFNDLKTILSHIPIKSLMDPLPVPAEMAAKCKSANEISCALYSVDSPVLSPHLSSFKSPFVNSFNALVRVSFILKAFCESVRLLNLLLGSASRASNEYETVTWDNKMWMSEVLPCLQTVPFAILEQVVMASVDLGSTVLVTPKLPLRDRTTSYPLLQAVNRFLRNDCTVYHHRAVNMMWTLEREVQGRELESFFARLLSNDTAASFREASDAFGILWRNTDDELTPGYSLKVPLYIILDAMDSEDIHRKQVSETWLRSNLRSYLRALDPLLHDLSSSTTNKAVITRRIVQREIQVFIYTDTIDDQTVFHAIRALTTLIRFGGSGLLRVLRSSPMKNGSSMTRLASSVRAPESSYFEVVLDVVLGFIQSEPDRDSPQYLLSMHDQIVARCLDTVQLLLTRSDVSKVRAQEIRSIMTEQLYVSVHCHRLHMQNKQLQVLHLAMSHIIPSAENSRMATTADSQAWGSDSQSDGNTLGSLSDSSNQSLVQVLVDGLSIQRNRPLLQHWLDFILTCLPQFPSLMKSAALPLCECIGELIQRSTAEMSSALQIEVTGDWDTVSYVTEIDMLALLNAFERITLLQLSASKTESSIEESSSGLDRNAQDPTGLFGYVSNVFASESTSAPSDGVSLARSNAKNLVNHVVNILYGMWIVISGLDKTANDLPIGRLSIRCRRVFEKLWRHRRQECFEAIVICWRSASHSVEYRVLDLLDALATNSLDLVSLACDSISSRLSLPTEPSNGNEISPDLDLDLLQLLEAYLRRLESPVAVQVWPRFLTLTREIISVVRERKSTLLLTLRCYLLVGPQVVQSSTLDVKRERKELQEVFVKLLEMCIQMNRPNATSSSWIRPPMLDSGANSGRSTPITKDVPNEKDDNGKILGTVHSDAALGDSRDLFNLLCDTVLPEIRLLVWDTDKLTSLCGQIIVQFYAPSLRSRASQSLNLTPEHLRLLRTLGDSNLPQKPLRNIIIEAFNDSRFFNISPETGQLWKPIIRIYVTADKTAFADTINRVSTTLSTNIFTNREHESLTCSLNLRRVSLAIWTCEKNHFLAQLPAVQEKLVEILRQITSHVVLSDVYLCVRVLACRISAHNLASFWPVLLAEMYRVFSQVFVTVPTPDSDELRALVAICKLLDTLLVLEREEFQVHQWIFITDTVDAIYRPDGLTSNAIVDRLSDVARDVEPHKTITALPENWQSTLRKGGRKPLLRHVQSVQTVQELTGFFENVSIASYESVYASNGCIDWAALEESIDEDIFVG